MQPSKFESTFSTSAGFIFGKVALTITSFLSGFGAGFVAASKEAFIQVADCLLSYSINGENSLQPAGPSNKAISRDLIPRKLFLTGIETTCNSNGNITYGRLGNLLKFGSRFS